MEWWWWRWGGGGVWRVGCGGWGGGGGWGGVVEGRVKMADGGGVVVDGGWGVRVGGWRCSDIRDKTPRGREFPIG